jgi:EpsI family protein
MTRTLLNSLVLGALMIGAAGVTPVVTPTVRMAGNGMSFDLAAMIPQHFGEWSVDTNVIPLKLDPETEAQLNKLYNQTLSRTYINERGDRIMLSIAYGGDQSEGLSVHKPEVCYAAQGFDIRSNDTASLQTTYGVLPIRRVVAVAGERNEPISYWMTIGNKVTQSGINQRLAQLKFGLGGVIPDGMLVRVSSIDRDPARSYQLQDKFVNDLLGSIDAKARERLIGVF